MLILGIETSCDDCSVAVVQNGFVVRSMVTASQVEIHRLTGGVVPEVAAREHAIAIMPTIRSALAQASCGLSDLDAIAVTRGPGLSSALLMGTMTASTLSFAAEKPLIGVHHILGHLYGNFLEREASQILFPYVTLTASGGHNHLILSRSHQEFSILGSTRDDAAGEAYDKVARMLGLSYPGGPSIEQAASSGDPLGYDLPRPLLDTGLEFSFSGLKSEVMRIVQGELGKGVLSREFVSDMAASFQRTVTEVLVTKLFRAAEEHDAAQVHIAGGVSANALLRQRVGEEADSRGISALFPVKKVYSTDNGAMIACRAYYQSAHRLDSYPVGATILPDPNLSLDFPS